MDQPSIYRKNLWFEQHKRVVHLLTLALALLEDGESLPDEEEEITRRLARCCNEVEYELSRSGPELPGTFHWEEKNWAQYLDASIPVKAVKKPDCQYRFRDQQAPNAESYAKSLPIECKRLGSFPHSSHTRRLNQEYVRDGIWRFLSDDHSYGKHAPLGIMIGYVQNMDLDEILAEVNAECRCREIEELVLGGDGWRPSRATHLHHSFVRSFPISPFALRHIWADLRRHYTPDFN